MKRYIILVLFSLLSVCSWAGGKIDILKSDTWFFSSASSSVESGKLSGAHLNFVSKGNKEELLLDCPVSGELSVYNWVFASNESVLQFTGNRDIKRMRIVSVTDNRLELAYDVDGVEVVVVWVR